MPRRPGTTPEFQRGLEDPFFGSRKGKAPKSRQMGRRERVLDIEPVMVSELGMVVVSEKLLKSFKDNLINILSQVEFGEKDTMALVCIKINNQIKGTGVDLSAQTLGTRLAFHYNSNNPPVGIFYVTEEFLREHSKK